MPAAPADSALVDSARQAGFDRAAYTDWLKQLRAGLRRAQIVLIFDEVFVGFRLAPGGAQEYFGVRPDMVTYGKSLGGGLPVGVLCGRSALMKRFRDDHPVDVCFARGTFNSHPYVMGAMDEFLQRLDDAGVAALYRGSRRTWNDRAATLNHRLQRGEVAGQVSNICRRSGPSAIRCRRATTGCCNITCAPRAWRSVGWAPAG